MSTMIYSKGDIVLFQFPFSNLKTKKVRPAVIVSEMGRKYKDVFIVPLTSRTDGLGKGEFISKEWKSAGLNVETAVKRGCYLADTKIIIKRVGILKSQDISRLNKSLKYWLDLE